jgi:hypothetical protein
MRCFLTSPLASRTRLARADWARHESAFHFERLLVDLAPSPQAWDFWQEVLSLSSSRTASPGAARPAPDLQGLLFVQPAVTILLTAAPDVEQAAVRHDQLRQFFTTLRVLAPLYPEFALATAPTLDRDRIRYFLWQVCLEDPNTRLWCEIRGPEVNCSHAVSISLLSRAYSAEGHTPEHRARAAQCAGCRTAAARAESEGPSSPIARRERAGLLGGARPPQLCAATRSSPFWWGPASELPFSCKEEPI